MTKVIALVSGGLDSTLAAGKNPDAELLFVDYGQPEALCEWLACFRIFGVKVTRISVLSVKRSGTYYPARNLMLATLAAQVAGEDVRVVMAGLKDDNCADKTPEAFAEMSRILTAQCGYRVTVESPFWDRTKAEVVGDFLQDAAKSMRLTLEDAHQFLLGTFSCYDPVAETGSACMGCPACFRWSVALRANGVAAPSPRGKVVHDYLARLHTYSPARAWATVKGLGNVLAVPLRLLCPGAAEAGGRWWHGVLCREQAEKASSHQGWVVVTSEADGRHRERIERWLNEQGVVYHGLMLQQWQEVACV